MMNDTLLQYLADIYPMALESQLHDELTARAQRKIEALADDDLMEQYDYVGELAERIRAEHRKSIEEGGEQ